MLFPFGPFLEMGCLDFSEHHNHPSALILLELITDPLPALPLQTLSWPGMHPVPLPQVACSHSHGLLFVSQALEKTRESK